MVIHINDRVFIYLNNKQTQTQLRNSYNYQSILSEQMYDNPHKTIWNLDYTYNHSFYDVQIINNLFIAFSLNSNHIDIYDLHTHSLITQLHSFYKIISMDCSLNYITFISNNGIISNYNISQITNINHNHTINPIQTNNIDAFNDNLSAIIKINQYTHDILISYIYYSFNSTLAPLQNNIQLFPYTNDNNLWELTYKYKITENNQLYLQHKLVHHIGISSTYIIIGDYSYNCLQGIIYTIIIESY